MDLQRDFYKQDVVINMDEDEFRQNIIGWIARMTRALESISESVKTIESDITGIRLSMPE